jgi:dihydropteroate synthase
MRQFGEQKRAFGNRDSLPAMRLGGTEFRWGERTYIMGVINVSPDSFSGDGISGVKEALEQAKRFVAEGADILDIGGESTRPDSKPVAEEEEIRRVVPVIEAIVAETRIPLSVDTYKPLVAERALEAGALMINHIWGLKKGSKLAQIAAEKGAPLILMSNQREEPAENIIPAVIRDLEIAIARALSAGVSPVNIIIDPGIGFGKTVEQNLELIYRLGEIRALGKPVLLGTSRKSVIGRTLGLPEEDRLEGTAATVAVGIAAGADIIRVHDVKAMKRVARMSDAIVRRS